MITDVKYISKFEIFWLIKILDKRHDLDFKLMLPQFIADIQGEGINFDETCRYLIFKPFMDMVKESKKITYNK